MASNKLNTVIRPALTCGAMLAAISASTIATPLVQQTWSSGGASDQNRTADERRLVRIVQDGGDKHTQSFSKTIYDVDDNGERTNIEVISENGHTVVKLNGQVVNEFDNDSWGKFEVKNTAGDVIAHVIQVPGGSVVVRPGDALSAFDAIGGIQVDLEALTDGFGVPGNLRFFGNDQPFGLAPKVMLGINMDDAPDGIQITSVIDGSPAAAAGLQDGDVIVQIDGEDVDSIGIRAIVREADPGHRIQIKVRRDGETVIVPVELEPFDPSVMGEYQFGPNWIEKQFGQGNTIFGLGNDSIQIDNLRERLDELRGPHGPSGLITKLYGDDMREAREEVAKLARQLEAEAAKMAHETGAAKRDIEQRIINLSKELSERSSEIARLSAEGAMRGLRFFGEPGEHGLAFRLDGDSPNLFELLTPDGQTIIAEPPLPPGGDDRYADLLRRYEAERAARRSAEARLQEMNERLERLEDRLGELLDKLNDR